jgi:hypothetical protein
MEIGVDSFAAMFSGNSNKKINDADALRIYVPLFFEFIENIFVGRI